MEDAHAAVLDLQKPDDPNEAGPDGPDKTGPEGRISFFGVYDGHGGDKVAMFSGENVHKILAKQSTFKDSNYEQALKDGFLATDRAILQGDSSMLICWLAFLLAGWCWNVTDDWHLID